MSVGPLGGIIASAAGIPTAQAKGSETERAAQDSVNQQRQAKGDFLAEAASGIGQTDGDDHEASERDADGRSPWKFSARKQDAASESQGPRGPVSRDATGESGTQLDLSG
jgi:hypothetical protein